MIKVAINGFGRIGRSVLRRVLEKKSDLEVVAINDLTDAETLAHLLKYDSLYGIYNKKIKASEDSIIIDSDRFKILAEPDPSKLPWKALQIDVVLECTGVFREFVRAKQHIEAGSKKVIISAPSRDPDKIPSFVLGVNEEKFDSKKDQIVDMGSCTTNCLAPIVKVLDENFGILRGFMTTIHSYTNDQRILDLPHKDLRRARAAAINIIPTTTGAAKAIGKVIPQLDGKLDGIALRVPTPTVSVLDLICILNKEITAEEVNFAFKKASKLERFKGVLGIEDAPLVSSDYIGNSYSAIVDAKMTKANNNLVKVLGWYDNEWGYACRMVDFAEFIGRKI